MAAAADSQDGEFKALIGSIHHSPIATILTDNRQPDNPILDVNDAFLELTGYGRDAVIGRNCRFLSGPGTEPEARAAVREAVTKGEPVVAEMTNYRKDGTPFRNALMIAPVLDSAGRIAMFMGSQMDIGMGEGAGGLRQSRARELVERLTPRLRQVLELMAIGYRNKQIGGVLGIGEKTVKMHRARMMDALGAKSSADAIRIALEANLPINDPDRHPDA